jgi:SOS response regulatory protein OraA/RecX
MTNKTDDLGIADTSLLTDSDWAEINKLKRAHDEGGSRALSKALEELKKDPVRIFRIMTAFYPEKMREAAKDVIAELGMTEEDFRELSQSLTRKAQSH